MDDPLWRESTIKKLTQILQLDNQVLSLSLFGSLVNTEVEKDKWSDIDALLVVEDAAFSKYSDSSDWLNSLGEIFVIMRSTGEQNQTTKVIFSDFRKIDLILLTKSRMLRKKPFWTKQVFVFTNSTEVKQFLEDNALKTELDNLNVYDLDKLANDFWFLAFTAVSKVVRNDLLIALHLALDLYRNCLLLGMWLRDKETGTYIHRIGGVRNDLVEKMDIKITDLSKEGILNLIENCGKEFDKLAKEWSPNYEAYAPLFKTAIDQAKKDLQS
ncbi:MAG: hypothetical protein C4584_00365 [Armatimonadetes bacterium]|nr:MAG: hypothetical protein C4584_00365 [Armatimonadota bacterium]